MLFSSTVFLFTFLPITLILYYIVQGRMKNGVILLASLIFYAWGEPVYMILMILSILFNYICGLVIARRRKNRRLARRSMIFTVVVDLALLVFFKYTGFLISSLNAAFPVEIPYQEASLPIGISFYTLQILSYIIDVYRGNAKVQKNLMDFALYVTLFPKLIAGPIVKYSDIEQQLRNRRNSWRQFGEGAMSFIRGLAKELLLANTMGMVYTEVTELTAGEMSVLSAWLGCAAYTFEIYFAFSGYSDMAIGLGEMFGFDFNRNFDYPYISTSITEFWRRWHISLGTWFREYVYIPLGGNRLTAWKHIRNLLVVWILTGLWHGAGWNFVAWGLYYGILLVIEKYFLGQILEKLPKALQHIYSILLVMIGWVLFASPSLGEAFRYLKVMFGAGAHGIIDREGLYLLKTNLGWWIILILGSTPVVHRYYEKWVRGNNRKSAIVHCVVYGAMFVLCIAYLVTETYNPFLYFQF